MSDVKPAIQCKYTCKACGIYRRVVTVPAREDEDIGTWLDSAAMLIGHDHRRQSPRCRSYKMDELMIPIGTETTGQASKIGGPIDTPRLT
jgi:hypothetical protein